MDTPDHLKKFDWYAPHQAWLAKNGYAHHAFPAGTEAKRAYLQGANLQDANLQNANLQNANLRYAYLQDANLRYAYLRDAYLQDANLQNANLRYANLQNADLQGAYLRDAYLQDANLQNANLRYAYLQGANLRSANGLPYVPLVLDIDSRILAAVSESRKCFDMGSWHSECGTTHCRAGWAVHLAGEGGKVAESILGTATAGALIYFKSAGYIPDFYADNATAMADMKERAKAALEGGAE